MNSLDETIREIAEHIAWVQYVYHLDGHNTMLSADKKDELTERFVKTFFPEHYGELFE